MLSTLDIIELYSNIQPSIRKEKWQLLSMAIFSKLLGICELGCQTFDYILATALTMECGFFPLLNIKSQQEFLLQRHLIKEPTRGAERKSIELFRLMGP